MVQLLLESRANPQIAGSPWGNSLFIYWPLDPDTKKWPRVFPVAALAEQPTSSHKGRTVSEVWSSDFPSPDKMTVFATRLQMRWFNTGMVPQSP